MLGTLTGLAYCCKAVFTIGYPHPTTAPHRSPTVPDPPIAPSLITPLPKLTPRSPDDRRNPDRPQATIAGDRHGIQAPPQQHQKVGDPRAEVLQVWSCEMRVGAASVQVPERFYP